MTYKLKNMHIILKSLSIVALMTVVVSCGNSKKEEKGELNDKKAKLEKLKGDQKKINDEILQLETEIGKSDPNAVTGKAKLVSVVTVSPQNFTHYIELQGKVDAENISYVSPRGGAAQVKAVFVKKGDYVKKGQL